MGFYYPQSAVLLRVKWEDWGESQKAYLQEVYDLPILCTNVTVNINEYTQASTFSLEIEYKNFPFDPRSIRALGVSIFMENMGGVFKTDNSLDQIKPNPDNAIFMGFADEESISFDDSKRTVKVEGRDYTGLLIDRKYPHGTINVQKRLDLVLTEVLSSLPETAKLKLDNRVPGELPVLSKFWAEQGHLAGQMNVQPDHTYWDVIGHIMSRAGLIAYMELDKLVLSTPRVIYNKERGKVFVYGKNLRSLDYKRKIGRMKNYNVVVRSMNLEKKSVDEAKIPAEATAAWSKDTGIPNKEMVIQTLKPDGTPVDLTSASGVNQKPQPAPYMSFRVADVADKDHLIQIGQKIYEEIGRQQLEGTLETHDLEIPDAAYDKGKLVDAVAFDILKLTIGTPLKIAIDQGDLHGFSRYTTEKAREAFLLRRGYKSQVAKAFAETAGKYDSIFYTKRIQYTMDAESGFKCKIDFINFIELPKSLAGG